MLIDLPDWKKISKIDNYYSLFVFDTLKIFTNLLIMFLKGYPLEAKTALKNWN